MIYEMIVSSMKLKDKTVVDEAEEFINPARADDTWGKMFSLDDNLRFFKVAFWREAKYCFETNQEFNILKVRKQTITPAQYRKIISNPKKLAYLLSHPVNEDIELEVALKKGRELWRKILNVDPVDENGKVDTKLVTQQLKIIERIEDRQRGSIAQKVEQRSMTMNLDGRSIEEQLHELESKYGQLPKEVKKIAGASEEILIDGGAPLSNNAK